MRPEAPRGTRAQAPNPKVPAYEARTREFIEASGSGLVTEQLALEHPQLAERCAELLFRHDETLAGLVERLVDVGRRLMPTFGRDGAVLGRGHAGGW